VRPAVSGAQHAIGADILVLSKTPPPTGFEQKIPAAAARDDRVVRQDRDYSSRVWMVEWLPPGHPAPGGGMVKCGGSVAVGGRWVLLTQSDAVIHKRLPHSTAPLALRIAANVEFAPIDRTSGAARLRELHLAQTPCSSSASSTQSKRLKPKRRRLNKR